MKRSLYFMTTALGLGVAALAAIGWAEGQTSALPRHRSPAVTALAVLTAQIPDGADAEKLRHGQDLMRAGDCVSCHMRKGGEPLSGGLGLKTPFGIIYSSNITPDLETGIGRWTPDQFYRAMHDGHGVNGENLYPAFPYPWFRNMSRADDDALLAYIKTTAPVRYTPPANELIFPLGYRSLVAGWNLLFLKNDQAAPVSEKSKAWNRGAYLVNGPGHCGACHTPKNAFGADRAGQEFKGAVVDNWTAPDLTGNVRTGLGAWSEADIAEYLKTGRNAHAGAGGAMADVVTYSTSLLTDADRAAIAVYLKDLPGSPSKSPTVLVDAASLSRGREIYSDACASCHLESGKGQPGLFPPLGKNAMVQQLDATGLEQLILAGTSIAATPSRPSPLSMPAFSWKLSDREIADVATFVRNNWGNRASAIDPDDVAVLRKQLKLQESRRTDNSGDQD
ncbi:cytochrome c [uncultured Bradyrhizobium sp.]|jgi:mono/diheme cytochrome c family protein|uniref:c-type cytochrome n=1 Tax=uncultured Bradyrhizobium sp. TaxID=199684 RepID=UPI0026398072|nr:cytochrome c [uncultured Bradyrhizobium sp.]